MATEYTNRGQLVSDRPAPGVGAIVNIAGIVARGRCEHEQESRKAPPYRIRVRIPVAAACSFFESVAKTGTEFLIYVFISSFIKSP